MKYINILLNILSIIISKLVPKNDKLWIFGSWFGDKFNDNSKYLFLYINKWYPYINVVWIAKNKDVINKINDLGYTCYRFNSIKSIIKLLRCKVVFFTQAHIDLSKYNWSRGSIQIQLWHGVAFKKIGNDIPTLKQNSIMNKLRLIKNNFDKKYDFYIAPSIEYSHKLKGAFNIKDDNKIIYSGQPRNDLFFNYDKEKIRKLKYKYFHSEDKFIITYMPTFRDNKNQVFSFLNLSQDQKSSLNKIIDSNIIIVEKAHFVDLEMRSKDIDVKSNSPNIIKCPDDIDAQELLLISDILITDYSSCYIDYLTLNRPIIHYLYDYNFYKNEDRGLYYDIGDVKGGFIAYNFDELMDCIVKYIANPKLDEDIRTKRKEFLCNFEDGHSCENITNTILKYLNND